MENKYPILEKTGHSYSGISDIVNNQPKGKLKQLVEEIDTYYNETIGIQERLEHQLERIKATRGMLVNDLINVHKAMGLEEKPLSFMRNNQLTSVTVKDVETIDYDRIPLTLL